MNIPIGEMRVIRCYLTLRKVPIPLLKMVPSLAFYLGGFSREPTSPKR